jgi:hypothetical protein
LKKEGKGGLMDPNNAVFGQAEERKSEDFFGCGKKPSSNISSRGEVLEGDRDFIARILEIFSRSAKARTRHR